MTTIHEIMQVGVGVPDRERFENFTRDLLGFPVTRSPDGKVSYVRPDQYRHRIAAITAAQPALQYIGFDVNGARDLAEWQSRLTGEGIEWRRGSWQECTERHVADFIEFSDPDGHHLALAYGFELGKEPVRYTRNLSVQRLGHVLLTVADTQRSHDFYTGRLGFRLSDWVNIDDNVRLCFLRCNERHHSIAFAPCMPGKAPRLQHVMLEVDSLDDVMRELRGFFTVCQSADVWPGGVHIELTGENVTECLGGSEAVLDDDLEQRYESDCDPRLNARQSLDLAFRVAELMRRLELAP